MRIAQCEAGVSFPVYYTPVNAALAEHWANGMSWKELCAQSSTLDEGDFYRLLHRTLEVLREIPLAYGIPTAVSRTARRAMVLVDRFPISDDSLFMENTTIPSNS